MADPSLLRDRLLAVPDPLFAVLDGARFDNLPDALLLGDFTARCLYLDRGGQGPDFDRNAPRLVWLDAPEGGDGDARDMADGRLEGIAGDGNAPPPRAATLDALLALIGDRPAAVFWVCPEGGEALYRHLRTINMVRVPADARTGEGEDYERASAGQAADRPEGTAEPAGDDTHELVTFRHADANVMAQVLPALDGAGFARLFGPATAILFSPDAEWGSASGVMVAPRPEGLPAAPSGPMTLDAATIGRIEKARQRNLIFRAKVYLKRVRPDLVGQINEKDLTDRVAAWVAEAQSYGVRTEAAIWKWCYLQLVTGGQLAKQSDVDSYMRSDRNSSTKDKRVDRLMSMTLARLKETG